MSYTRSFYRFSRVPPTRVFQKWCTFVACVSFVLCIIIGLARSPQPVALDREVLVAVVAINRHGDRYNLRSFSFERISHIFPPLPYQYGTLTRKGLQQAYALGADIYHTYLTDIEATWGHVAGHPADLIKVTATDFHRTVDTANAALLATLLPKPPSLDPPPDLDHSCSCREAANGGRTPPQCLATCLGLRNPPPRMARIHVTDNPSNLAVFQGANCRAFGTDMDLLQPSLDAMQRSKYAPEMDLLSNLIRATEPDSDGAYTWAEYPKSADVDAKTDANLSLLGKVWDTVVCCSQHEVAYSSVASNQQLLSSFDPVVTDVRHRKFSDQFGSDLGGILLADLLAYLQQQAGAYVSMKGCPSLRVAPRKRHAFPSTLADVAVPNFSAASAELDLTDVEQPFLLISAHDDTLMSILASMRAADALPLPWFASYVALELTVGPGKGPGGPEEEVDDAPGVGGAPSWRCPDYEFFVRVVFNGQSVEVEGDGAGPWELGKFVQLLQGRAVSRAECIPSEKEVEWL